MNATYKKRYYNDFTDLSIKENGVRLGDCLIMKRLGAKKHVVCLNRLEYDFYGKNFCVQKNFEFVLEDFDTGEKEFSLIVCPSMTGQTDNQGRYLLKSHGKKPFKLNGNSCFEAFVERGDHILLGGNILQFENKENEDNDDLHPILYEKKVIKSHLPILIEGESGVGKTLLAEKIHEISEQKGTFVHLNLSSFSAHLLESELFGHVKGAFTGSVRDKKGAFLEASGGTLFLDEIDSISLDLQVKLLLFLDKQKIRPVGDDKEYRVNTRLIFAAGRNLAPMVKKKRIREDFYFRINSGIRIHLPALKEQPELITKCCQQFARSHNIRISENLLQFYKKYQWPGNYRQLVSHLHKKKVMAKKSLLHFDHYDEELCFDQNFHTLHKEMDDNYELEKVKLSHIKKVFYLVDRNIMMASQLLNIHSTTLRRMVAQEKI